MVANFSIVAAGRRVSSFDMTRAPWVEAGKDGLRQKLVRGDPERGEFLGLLAFDALVASGLHQHTGVTSSYMLSGSVTDYWGTYAEGSVGINVQGSTHDAICYTPCLMANRAEAPVLYPNDATLHALHHGSRHGAFANPAPEALPTSSLDVATTPSVATAVAGVTRRMLFDYARAGQDGRHPVSADHRLVALTIVPGTSLPAFRTSALTEFFVIGGALRLNDGVRDIEAGPASFVIVEPDTEVVIDAAFGAQIMAWVDGPTRWCDRDGAELFGF